LVKCNAHYRGKSQFWKQRGVDPRDIRCRVANRATRTIFQMVSGRQVYRHPSRLGRQYILDKLLKFHQEHHSAPVEILRDLQAAAELIPRTEITAETAPLQPIADRYRRARRKGPQPVGEIVLVLLARLGAGSWPEADGELQSEPSRVEASDRLTSRIDASHR
jgi:hypothetical protein